MQQLSQRAARSVAASAPDGLIFPARPDLEGVTNRLAFLTDAGSGPAMARAAADAVNDEWNRLVRETFHPRPAPDTPGVPDLAWVSVTGPADGYDSLWRTAQQELVARRRARVFAPLLDKRVHLCAQSAGLPAVPAPPHLPEHQRAERLSAAGWTKRRSQRQRFPSTAAVASRAYCRRLSAAAADGLGEAVERSAAAVEGLRAGRST